MITIRANIITGEKTVIRVWDDPRDKIAEGKVIGLFAEWLLENNCADPKVAECVSRSQDKKQPE